MKKTTLIVLFCMAGLTSCTNSFLNQEESFCKKMQSSVRNPNRDVIMHLSFNGISLGAPLDETIEKAEQDSIIKDVTIYPDSVTCKTIVWIPDGCKRRDIDMTIYPYENRISKFVIHTDDSYVCRYLEDYHRENYIGAISREFKTGLSFLGRGRIKQTTVWPYKNQTIILKKTAKIKEQGVNFIVLRINNTTVYDEKISVIYSETNPGDTASDKGISGLSYPPYKDSTATISISGITIGRPYRETIAESENSGAIKNIEMSADSTSCTAVIAIPERSHKGKANLKIYSHDDIIVRLVVNPSDSDTDKALEEQISSQYRHYVTFYDEQKKSKRKSEGTSTTVWTFKDMTIKMIRPFEKVKDLSRTSTFFEKSTYVFSSNNIPAGPTGAK